MFSIKQVVFNENINDSLVKSIALYNSDIMVRV